MLERNPAAAVTLPRSGLKQKLRLIAGSMQKPRLTAGSMQKFLLTDELKRCCDYNYH